MPLPGSWIYATYLFKNKFKALNTLLNSAEYTITRNRICLFPCLKILLGHSNRWTLCNHHEPSCGVCSSWEDRDTLALSPLPFHPLEPNPSLNTYNEPAIWINLFKEQLNGLERYNPVLIIFTVNIVTFCTYRAYSNKKTLCSHHKPSCGVWFSWEGRDLSPSIPLGPNPS